MTVISELQTPIKIATKTRKDIVLNPGKNELTKSEWSEVLKNVLVEYFINNGSIKAKEG